MFKKTQQPSTGAAARGAPGKSSKLKQRKKKGTSCSDSVLNTDITQLINTCYTDEKLIINMVKIMTTNTCLNNK